MNRDWIAKMTFDGLICYGRSAGAVLHGEKRMPWSFKVWGVPVTHETDERYILCLPTGNCDFLPGDILIVKEDGKIEVAAAI